MPSGTNLLGLVKHLATMEVSYLGDCLDRPAPFHLPWVGGRVDLGLRRHVGHG
jgi:hypothetical protein